jgi:hypothetical protein
MSWTKNKESAQAVGWLGLVFVVVVLFSLIGRCAGREYQAEDAVVRIKDTSGGTQSWTSGVIYAKRGGYAYALTCRHGITGTQAQASPWRQGTRSAQVMDDYGTSADVMVIRFRSDGEQPVFPASYDPPRVGDSVVYVGWPVNSSAPVYRSGKITSMNAQSMDGSQRYMATNIPVEQGGSGGAFLKDGKIIGVQWGSRSGESFGTPLAYASKVSLTQYCYPGGNCYTYPRRYNYVLPWRRNVAENLYAQRAINAKTPAPMPTYTPKPSPIQNDLTPSQNPQQPEIDYDKLADLIAAKLPKPADGKDGEPGPPGRDGVDGQPGTNHDPQEMVAIRDRVASVEDRVTQLETKLAEAGIWVRHIDYRGNASPEVEVKLGQRLDIKQPLWIWSEEKQMYIQVQANARN